MALLHSENRQLFSLQFFPSVFALEFNLLSSDCIANGRSSLIAFEYILLSRHDAFNKVSNIQVFRSRVYETVIRYTHCIFFFFGREFSRLKILEISQVKITIFKRMGNAFPRYPEISGHGVMENVIFSQEMRQQSCILIFFPSFCSALSICGSDTVISMKFLEEARPF